MWEPHPDLAAAKLLGQILRTAGYDREAIEELLGEDGPAADLGDAPLLERRLPDDELGTLVALFLLQRPVAQADAEAALGPHGLEAVHTLGFAQRRDGRLEPRARIVPTEGLYLAFDGFSRGEHDPAGWVASFTPTAYWLASLTPRRRVSRALDVGTGNGAHALLASRHSEHVVATDVNPRALAFTQISAALNGIENVETRLGSLFEPVEGETFDLITCNAPYVISPERRWQYRDGGLRGDELSRRVVVEAALHLAEDGFASMLVSWLADSEDDPDAHVRAWVADNGCDAWLLSLSAADPLDHAAAWNDHLAADPEALAETVDEWAGYLEELGAGWVTEGAVVQHRRTGSRNLVRADEADEDDLEYASDQVERVFRGLALLAEEGDAALENHRLRLAADVRLVEERDGSGAVRSSTIVLHEGSWPEHDLDPDAAEALLALGAGRILPKPLHAVGRELLEAGYLEIVE